MLSGSEKIIPQSGDLLDIVALDRTGVLVTSDGVLVRIVEVTTRDPRVMGDDERERMSQGFVTMCGRLQPGQSLQFYVEGSPLLLPRVLDEMRAEVDRALNGEATDRALALRRLAEGHEQSLQEHVATRAAVDFRAFVVVPYAPTQRGAGLDWQALLANRRLSTTPLTRGLEQHQRAVHESLVHTNVIIRDLAALDLSAQIMDGLAVGELLFRRFNPSSAGTGYRPRLEVLGSLDELDDAKAAARSAHALREQIAASPVTFEDWQCVRVEECLERVHYLSVPPDYTWFGMLLKAMEIDHPFALSMHVHALDRRSERDKVKRGRMQLHGVIEGGKARRRPPSVEMKEKKKEQTRLLKELAGEQAGRLWNVSVYQSVREPGPVSDKGDLLDASKRTVSAIRDTEGADAKFGGFMQRDLWRATLPIGRDPAKRTRKYVSRNVGDMVPLVGSSCGNRTGIPMFFADGVRSLLRFNPWARENLNGLMTVNGQQGTGKTMFGITTMARLLPHGVHGTAIDRSGSHWELLTRLVPGSAYLAFGSASSDVAINPWDVPDLRRVSDEKVRFLLALHEVMLGSVSDEGKNLLIEGIQGVYACCAREQRQPLERDLKAELERLSVQAQADAKDRTTKRVEDLATLATRLTRYVAPGPDAFLVDRPTTVPEDSPLVVFDTRHAGAHLAAAMLLMLEHTVTKVERRTRERIERGGSELLFPGDMLVADEMWKLMEHESTGEWVHDLSRRSRHLGLLLLALTQYLTDFDNPYGRALLDSAHMKLFFKQSKEQLEKMRTTLGLSNAEVKLIAGLNTAKGRGARAYWMNGPWGSGVVDVLFGGLEYWMATSEPGHDVPLRSAVLARHDGDAWAALEELAAMEGVR